MINIQDKKKCCGCSACEQVCPKGCIQMVADHEGFLYPKVDTSVCIDCHLCEKVCPVLNVESEKERPQKGYIVQHKDEDILRQSTSGGAFTAIASWVIEQGGVVFGAAYNKDFVVHHDWVERVEELQRFRNSKYTQSEIRETFQETKAFLEAGRIVLYSGTPCQLEGLLNFLKKDYENLITIDVVCRACPSPFVFKKYLEMQGQKFGKSFENVLFRDKYYGYGYSSMTIKTKERILYHEGIDTDPYLRAFFSEISIRPSCTACKFRKRYRKTDFTIWDCFDIAKYSKDMNNDKGATKVLVHTERADAIMLRLKDRLKLCPANPQQMLMLDGNNEIDIKLAQNPMRREFFEDLDILPSDEFFAKYFPVRMKNYVEKYIRIATYKLGLYQVIKSLYVKMVGREKLQR